MTAVMGLDLSTTRAGVALPDGRTLSVTPGPTRRPVNIGRRLDIIAWQIIGHVRVARPDLVVIEGYAMHAPGPLSMIRLAELGGCVRRDLHAAGVPYIEVPPKQLKKWATGNGAASKDDMVAAARTGGGTVANHDEADAWLARALGLHGMDGLEVARGPLVSAEVRADVVAAIQWPVLAR